MIHRDHLLGHHGLLVDISVTLIEVIVSEILKRIRMLLMLKAKCHAGRMDLMLLLLLRAVINDK